MIKQLLSNINLTHILVIVMIGLVGSTSILFTKWQNEKEKAIIAKDNFKQIQKLNSSKDSLKTAFYKFRTNQELNEYIQQNDYLQTVLRKEKIKTKNIQFLVNQLQTYKDSTEKKSDVSELVDNIRHDKPSFATWEDKTECLTINGNVAYKNDTLSVNVINRVFNDEQVIIGHLERNKWSFLGLFKTKIFGRKKAIVTAQSKCSKNKTVVIDKTK